LPLERLEAVQTEIEDIRAGPALRDSAPRRSARQSGPRDGRQQRGCNRASRLRSLNCLRQIAVPIAATIDGPWGEALKPISTHDRTRSQPKEGSEFTVTHSAQEEKGLVLEYLSKLTLFDSTFEYKGQRYDYSDIQHIEFTAVSTKHSVNFVPAGTSYSATLILHISDGRRRLHIKQERNFLNRKEKEHSEAFMRAAGIFMDITFNRRIEGYEREMEKKGFVSWGRHQLSRNGDLFRKNELRFNILTDDIACNLGPFQVECRKRKPGIGDKLKELWSGPVEVIDISTDKDCFLYIMKHYLGLSWRNQPVPEKRRSGNEIFKEALLVLGGKLCKADGRVSPEEIIVFKQYFEIDDRTYPGASKIFMESAKTSVDTKESARRIFALLDRKTEALEYIIIGLMQVASADGRIHKTEMDFIHIVAEEFDFSSAEIHRLFLLFEQAQGHAYGSRGAKTRTQAASLRFQYLEVLGLDENAAFGEIKAAYHNLARKHHPDLLRAQGVPIDDIKNAEEILKVINSAYEWLARYHQNDAKATG
jgi:DnaJ like chaperone protein